MRRKYAMMRHQLDVAQRRKDPATERVTKEREIPSLMCSWKTFIRIETKKINVAYTVHSQLVRSCFASSDMFIVGGFQN
jgi:acetolactate synthase regulatory subunit